MQDIKVEFKEIPVASIFVDHQAQRKFDEAWATFLFEHWDESLADIITVSARDDGRYHTTSGQHRLSVYRRQGRETVMAKVIYGLDISGEAMNFLGHIGRATRYVDKFTLSVVAGLEPEVSMDKLLRFHGWVASDGSGDGHFKALQRLRIFAMKTNGMDLVGNILGTITQTWGHDAEAVHQNIIMGFGKLYVMRPALDQQRLVKVLRATTPGSFRASADALRVKLLPVPSAGAAHADQAVRLYNSGLRGSGRLQQIV